MPKHIGFFVTCLADLFRPSVAFASIKLLEQAGYQVDVPDTQTCCGQPAFNSGDDENARDIAKNVISAFEGFDYVVGPSGSCMGTIKTHYPALFADQPHWKMRAQTLADKSWEIMSFLHDVAKVELKQVSFEKTYTYHDSCSGLRELGIHQQPRNLLNQVTGAELVEMEENNVCCGFGGTFCVKYPDISERMVDEKIKNIENTNADVLLAGDLGCLLNMSGRLTRLGKKIDCYHTVEVLAGMADQPAIGKGNDN